MNLPPTEKIILRDAKTKLISFELIIFTLSVFTFILVGFTINCKV